MCWFVHLHIYSTGRQLVSIIYKKEIGEKIIPLATRNSQPSRWAFAGQD